ncbi:hypothetical protein [Pedobacter paludis]|uniref:TonB-dependent receptor plug domain-containing protein n=1 Tax=Pedobacter paludis TaxID=2203212 RepID=A0A317F5Z0_9SPHI|nr:hypothetical protein [Pedobacter paludis]PWS32966.1 hypothetical protein DF947_07825 [Pedobacter paludis]
MKLKALLILFLIFAGNASAQISDAFNRDLEKNRVIKSEKPVRICAPSRAGVLANPPLYVVNDIEDFNPTSFSAINPKDIESMQVFKYSEAKDKYGDKAKNGVISVTLKKGVKLLALYKVLGKIKKRDLNLPIYINTEKLIIREGFYLSENKIESVKVIEKPTDKIKEERYIQILLKP